MQFYLLKFDFFETRKPENPKGLNPNPKVDFSIQPEPDQTRNMFCNWNPIKPEPESSSQTSTRTRRILNPTHH